VTTERRDLYRRPLQRSELAGFANTGFDGVVFDPPRAGAEAQARELAASDVERIAAVSCNPVTFARDLSLLVAGGYRIQSVTPLDQFVFTPHVEAVALLQR
ncbi:MAG: RNA methyltransferase, partial [Salaquimonas sp.]|nr:RNA methyltransferase [Salaquimonas sp.]